LSKELGGLPMALRAAENYIRAVNDATYVSRPSEISDFRGYRAEVRERFANPPGGGIPPLNETRGLKILQHAFGMSLDLLAKDGFPQAGPLLKLFACLNVRFRPTGPPA
jgi:hypothetical protein